MARYATIDWDVNGSPSESQWTVDADSVAWTEFTSGASPCCDGALDVTTGAGSDYGLVGQRRYLGRVAHADLDPNTGDPIETRYSRGDLIDSMQIQTDDAGDPVLSGAVSYTGFGEYIGPAGVGDGSDHTGLGTRYVYGAGWGYESGLLGLSGAHAWDASGAGYSGANPNLAPITFQHLGWRWYQPDIGRFVQRDPIGIRGGFNVYVLAGSNPTNSVDPLGLNSIIPDSWLQGIVNVFGDRNVLAATGGNGYTYGDCVGDCVAELGAIPGVGGVAGGALNIPTSWRPAAMGPGASGKARLISALCVKCGADKSPMVINALKATRGVKGGVAMALIGAGATAAAIEAYCALVCEECGF